MYLVAAALDTCHYAMMGTNLTVRQRSVSNIVLLCIQCTSRYQFKTVYYQ